MSTNPEMPAGGDNLQFDRAEIGGQEGQAGVACSFCRQPITGTYYQVNQRATCNTCLARVREMLFGGSGLRRTMLALLLGALAALLGTGIYFGVEAITNLHIGFVAIVVGLLVGGAVRKGSAGRGGWFYQLMAIFLTYASISGSYLLVAVKELAEERQTPAAHSTDYTPVSKGSPADSESDQPGNPGQQGQALAPKPSIVALLFSLAFALVFVVGLSLYLPIMAGMQSPILLLITGFALFEAWKMNKRPALRITGPHDVEGSPTGAPPALPAAPLPPGTRP